MTTPNDPPEEIGVSRVVLVSARPLFRRTFGKLIATLRDDLTVDGAASAEALGDRAGGALVLLDAGGGGAADLARDVSVARAFAGPAGVVAVLDEADDALTDVAMEAGARGVMIKAAPPGVLAEWLDALLEGEIVRPAPSVALAPEALSEALRARLSARRQKLLRLQMGGTSIGETARLLGMTPAKVVSETRIVMDIVRGRAAGD